MTWKASRPVYLVDGVRTPFLRAGRAPGPFSASQLAAAAMQALLKRQPLAATDIDEVVLGCVLPAPQEVNIARLAMLRAGLDKRTPALTVNRVCGSGLQAIDTAARAIADAAAAVVLAGGTESMSHAPLVAPRALAEALAALREADSDERRLALAEQLVESGLQPASSMFCALSDALVNMRMGDTAEVLARRFAIPRQQQDAFALGSHRRAAQAWREGRFDGEVAPLATPDGATVQHDTGIRHDTSAERLAALKPAFDDNGTVTAGNSSQITDGAAVVLLAGEDALNRHGLVPLARIRAVTWAGLEPREMGLGPAHAIARLVRETGLQLDEVDAFEINEAFAAQVLACRQALADADFCRHELGLPQAAGEIPLQRLNVDGGAIALGHPLGASGARIVLHLARVLQRSGGRLGVAALCIGGGQGGALLLERV